MASVVRGKALVVKLRAEAGVRNAEALAAWAGRTKRLRAAGVPPRAAAIFAAKENGMTAAKASSARSASSAGLSPRQQRLAAHGFEEPSEADRKRLRIPPAWRDVRIDRSPNASLLAVGLDKKGREQRMYSAAHHEKQAAAKFARIEALHERLPEIDKRLSEDAKTDDTALAALMIRRMGLRPGSDADTKAEKKAHGATNLKASHVETRDGTLRASFTGKKGVDLDLSLDDPELAKLLEGRKENKSGDDRLLDTNDRKLREYMKRVAPGVKPKDFRTYRGTMSAKRIVSEMPVPKTKKEHQSQRLEVGKQVGRLLGNTPSVALSSYIAPSTFGPWDSALREES